MFKINIDIVFKFISALLIILFVLIQTYYAGADSVRAELRDEYHRTLQLESDKFNVEFNQYKDATADAQTKLNNYWRRREADAADAADATVITTARVEAIKHEKVTPVDNCIVSNNDIRLLIDTVALIEPPFPQDPRSKNSLTGNQSDPLSAMLYRPETGEAKHF